MDSLETLPPGYPELTIGFDVAAWCQDWLVQPDGDDAGSAWRFTPEQRRFMDWWYAVDDEGRPIFRRGSLRRSKGWGKDPLAAVLALAEMLGPCRFDVLEDGEAYGRPHPMPWVQIGATSKDQTATTTHLLPSLLPKQTIRRYRLDVLNTMIRGNVNGASALLEAVSNSWTSQEGARPSFFVMNETHLWTATNGGHAMSDVVRRNLAKARAGASRALSFSNAYEEGEDSVEERTHKAWQKLSRERPDQLDILYDSVEPVLPKEFTTDDDELLAAALQVAYGDASWVELDRIMAEIRDPDTDEATAQRFFLNLIVSGSGRWLSPAAWDAAYLEGDVADGAQIAVGFDGAKSRDSTAIVCTELETGFQWLEAVWERDWAEVNWEVPEHEVEETVDSIMERFRVERFYCDPPYWEEAVARWQGRYPKIVLPWWTSGRNTLRVARSLQTYQLAIIGRIARHGGALDPVFRRHIVNTYKREVGGRAGDGELVTIRKASPDSRRSIDAAMAGMLSWQARNDAIAAGALRPKAKLKLWTPEASRKRREARAKERAEQSPAR